MKTTLLVSLATVALAVAPGCEGKKDTAAAGGTPQAPPAPGAEARVPDGGGPRVPDQAPGEPKPRPPAGGTARPEPAPDTPRPPQPEPGKAKRDRGAALLAELEKLPVGIKVVHTPVKLKARKNDGTLPHIDARWTYHWSYTTTVSATDKPLTVVAFGSCEWIDGAWAIPQDSAEYDVIAGSGKEFGEWYACPGGKLDVGKEYTDPQNWSGSKSVRAFKQKWYYIARDKDGKLYKGEADVELLGELDGAAAKDEPGSGK